MRRMRAVGISSLALVLIAGAGWLLFKVDPRATDASPPAQLARAEGTPDASAPDGVAAPAIAAPETVDDATRRDAAPRATPRKVEDDYRATIAVRVEDKKGDPLAGVTLRCTPAFRDMRASRYSGYSSEQHTDAHGEASFEVPPIGSFAIRGAKDGFAVNLLQPVLPDDRVTLTLEPGRRLAGIVLGDETGQPEPGAHVVVSARGERRVFDTDAGGRFAITELPPDPLDVDVFAEGFDRVRLKNVVAGDDPQAQLEIRLPSGVEIHGRVRDGAAKEGLAGASVKLVADVRVGEEPRTLLAVETQTAADGTFSFGSVPRDGVDVVVQAEGFAPERKGLSFNEDEPAEVIIDLMPASAIEGTVQRADGTPVAGAEVRLIGSPRIDESPLTATSGEKGEFRFDAVHPGPNLALLVKPPEPDLAPAQRGGLPVVAGQTLEAVVVTLDQAATIEGRVVGIDGRGAPYARVTVEKVPGYAWRALKSGPQFLADATGSFTVEGIPASSVVVSAKLDEAFSQPQKLELVAGVTQPVEIRLEQGAVIRGTVVDAAGLPVADALVSAFRQDPGFQTPSIEPAPANADPKKKEGPKLKIGGRKIDVAEYRDRDGDPTQRLLSAATGGGDRQGWAFRGFARTDASGVFAVGGLAPGENYSLSVRHPEYSPWLEVGVPADGQPRDIHLGLLLELDGVVLDSATRRPLPEFRVTAQPIDEVPAELAVRTLDDALRLRRTRTQSFRSLDGSFVLTGLEPGLYEVSARADDYRDDKPVRMRLVAGTEPQATLMLVATSSISGRVTAPDGSPIRRASVFLRKPPPPEAVAADAKAPNKKKGRPDVKRRETDAAGRFRFTDVAPGTYELGLGSVGAPLAGPVSIEIREGESEEQNFQVPAVGELTVEARGVGGFSLDKAMVTLQGKQTRSQIRARTDGFGRAAFGNLLPDQYQVTIEHGGYEKKTDSVKIGANDERSEIYALTQDD